MIALMLTAANDGVRRNAFGEIEEEEEDILVLLERSRQRARDAAEAAKAQAAAEAEEAAFKASGRKRKVLPLPRIRRDGVLVPAPPIPTPEEIAAERAAEVSKT